MTHASSPKYVDDDSFNKGLISFFNSQLKIADTKTKLIGVNNTRWVNKKIRTSMRLNQLLENFENEDSALVSFTNVLISYFHNINESEWNSIIQWINNGCETEEEEDE